MSGLTGMAVVARATGGVGALHAVGGFYERRDMMKRVSLVMLPMMPA